MRRLHSRFGLLGLPARGADELFLWDAGAAVFVDDLHINPTVGVRPLAPGGIARVIILVRAPNMAVDGAHVAALRPRRRTIGTAKRLPAASIAGPEPVMAQVTVIPPAFSMFGCGVQFGVLLRQGDRRSSVWRRLEACGPML